MDIPRPGDPVLVIEVTYRPGHLFSEVDGEIYIELFPDWAPITVANMIQHVEVGLYDGIFFHRVIDDFVIQTGDDTCTTIGIYPASDPSCGSNGSDENIPFEANANLTHINGAVGMARGVDPDSASSQFYICDESQHGLDNGNRTQDDDPGYAVFGVVREGMDIVQATAQVPTSNDPANRPLYEVHVNSITLEGFVTNSIEEKENEKIPNTSFSLSILSIGLLTLLRRN